MTAHTSEQRVSTPGKEPGRRRVLLVEDDADHRNLIAWMLRAEDYEVVEAESGIELLDRIGASTSAPRGAGFDAIVSDVNMPDLTAIEVLAGWRYGAWPVPLILITASEDPMIRSEGNALGASAVLTKPVRRNDLLRALERALAGRKIA
ncbi:MAG TPA: response regulator [Candidatus Binatus sp.]|nr:response regulator [Candidatus Binatus sp.]